MHDNRSHPLLEQVPLTVSPFVNLPRAATLPYRYKAMPSALPPTIIGDPEGSSAAAAAASSTEGVSTSAKRPYVVSATSGSAAHPDDILASCRALREHIGRMQADADAQLRALEERIQERDLAEKRRVAPGWLDSEEHLLVPERLGGGGQEPAPSDSSQTSSHVTSQADKTLMAPAASEAGEELRRSLGGLHLQ